MSHLYESQRAYQRAGSRFLAKAGSGILTDEPGLGKTIQALGSILADHAHRYGPEDIYRSWHLVACPKVAVKNVWEPEIHRWLRGIKYEVLTLTGSINDRRRMLAEFVPRRDTRHVFVVTNLESLRVVPVVDYVEEKVDGKIRKNYVGGVKPSRRDVIRFTKKTRDSKTHMVFAAENAMIPDLLHHSWDTVICDESQRALIRGSNSTPSQVRAGFVMIGTEARRRLALSGTPMRGKPEQLFGTLAWLHPEDYTNYWAWVGHHFEVEKGRYGWKVLGLKPGGEASLAKELKPLMLRRTKQEVAPELPPKTYAGYHLIPGDDQSPLGVWLELSDEQRRQYEVLEADGVVGGAMVTGVLADYTRRRQLAAAACDVEWLDEEKVRLIPRVDDSPKLDWLLEWLDVNEEKIVVVSQFTSVLEAFAEKIADEGHRVALLTGNVGERARSKAIEGFMHGDVRVFLLNTQAGGVALTLDNADYMVFLDETSIPDDQIQAEDRIHRISRSHNVTIYYLRMLETIEEEVAYIAAARHDVQQYLLDGARGVEYAKQVYLMERNKKEAQR